MYEIGGIPREENATFVHLKCRGFLLCLYLSVCQFYKL